MRSHTPQTSSQLTNLLLFFPLPGAFVWHISFWLLHALWYKEIKTNLVNSALWGARHRSLSCHPRTPDWNTFRSFFCFTYKNCQIVRPFRKTLSPPGLCENRKKMYCHLVCVANLPPLPLHPKVTITCASLARATWPPWRTLVSFLCQEERWFKDKGLLFNEEL